MSGVVYLHNYIYNGLPCLDMRTIGLMLDNVGRELIT